MESEYVCYPNAFNPLSRTEWIGYALDSLVYPSESLLANPWYRTSAAQAHRGMVSYVAGEFYRLEFESKSKIGKMPPCRDPEMVRQKKLVKACALLWSKTWRVLERMESMGRLPLPPSLLISASHYPQQSIVPLWMMSLVLEGELLTPWLDCVSPDGSSGFKALLKQQQNDNKRLQCCEDNPFASSCTRLFIGSAIDTAGEFDQFKNNYYTPMVKQRQSVTALIAKEKFVAFDLDGKPSRQGRRK